MIMGTKKNSTGDGEQAKKPSCPIRLAAFEDLRTTCALVVHMHTHSRFAVDMHVRVATRDEAWRTGCRETHHAVIVDGDARSDQTALQCLHAETEAWTAGAQWALRDPTRTV